MLVVNRFRAEDESFRDDLQAVLTVLGERPGFLSGEIGRNLDDPDLWVLVTRWESVGGYRRALSSYEVKVGAVPTLSRALDEPSAYEPVLPGGTLNSAAARSL